MRDSKRIHVRIVLPCLDELRSICELMFMPSLYLNRLLKLDRRVQRLIHKIILCFIRSDHVLSVRCSVSDELINENSILLVPIHALHELIRFDDIDDSFEAWTCEREGVRVRARSYVFETTDIPTGELADKDILNVLNFGDFAFTGHLLKNLRLSWVLLIL
jgi:hypothetical protein